MVDRDNLFLLSLEREIALIKLNHILQERCLDLQAGILRPLGIDHANRLSEPQDDGLGALFDHVEAVDQDHDDTDRQDRPNAKRTVHRWAPVVA